MLSPGALGPPVPWQVHICMMRLLAEDEDRADRAERSLDLALLDAVTWPEFVWDWLRLVGELSALGSALRISPKHQDS